ncbi:hypothetical protein BH09MYX1_BH09MYX1_29300 [soil metagenome]
MCAAATMSSSRKSVTATRRRGRTFAIARVVSIGGSGGVALPRRAVGSDFDSGRWSIMDRERSARRAAVPDTNPDIACGLDGCFDGGTGSRGECSPSWSPAVAHSRRPRRGQRRARAPPSHLPHRHRRWRAPAPRWRRICRSSRSSALAARALEYVDREGALEELSPGSVTTAGLVVDCGGMVSGADVDVSRRGGDGPSPRARGCQDTGIPHGVEARSRDARREAAEEREGIHLDRGRPILV